jgi:hypothetical protein
VNTTPPYIAAIDNAGTTTSASASLNSSGYFEIYGSSLTASGGDPAPQVSVSGSGVTLSVTYASDIQVNVYYTVSGNAATGAYGITITTYAGTSNTVNMNVGDPTPVIGSVSPNSWNAGATTAFTITGQGFGTSPTLAIGGSGITAYGIVGTPTDTAISATVTRRGERAEWDGQGGGDVKRLRQRISADAAGAIADRAGERDDCS